MASPPRRPPAADGTFDLAGFLAAHPPFDALGEEARAEVAAAATTRRYAAGELVLDAFASPSDEVFLVLSGRLDLWNDVETLAWSADESLGPGGLVGFSAMLTERSVGPRAVAAEDSWLARLPAAAAVPVFASRRGARFLADHLAQSHTPGVQDVPTYATLAELIRQPALLVDPDRSVGSVAQAMTERRVAAAVVELGPGRVGLVTDATLRRRVLAEGLPTGTPVRDVAEADPPTAGLGDSAAEALIDLLDRGADFLLVTGPAGDVRGVVGPRDFAVSPTTSGVSVHEQLRHASTTAELVDRARRVPHTVEELLTRGLASDRVIRVYSSIVDTLVRRAIQLTFAAHPDLDVDAFTWLSLGSTGRGEAVPSSDLDSAVAFADDVPESKLPAYRRAFAEVEQLLVQAGMVGDQHGTSADRPMFSRRHAQWRRAGEGWLARPAEDNGAMLTSLLLDARPVYGDPGMTAVAEVFGDLRRHPGTMRLLLQESLSYRARMRSWRDLLGLGVGTFDIKAHAVLPVVNLARWSAVAVGSTALSTTQRLYAAAGSTMLPEDRVETLVEGFRLLQRIRLRYQLLQLAAGDQPSDVLTVERLSPIDRSLVTEAVREIAAIQRRMTNLAHYLPAEGWVAADPG